MLAAATLFLASILVPLHAVTGDDGFPRLGVEVRVGGDRVPVLVDTGSPGLRILASSIRAGSAKRRGMKAQGWYMAGLRLRGEAAFATLQIGTARGSAIPIELVDGYSWGGSSSRRTPEMFGGLFSGILGLDMRGVPPTKCCANPLPELAGGVGRRYIVHAKSDTPSLLLDPGTVALRGFTMLSAHAGPWPVGCVRVSDILPRELCGELVFDTGTPQLNIAGPGLRETRIAAPGAVATVRSSGWSQTFTDAPNLTVIVHNAPVNRIIIGLEPMRSLDVLFDVGAHAIGVRPSR